MDLVICFFSVLPDISDDFPSFAGELREQPIIVLQSVGLAVSQVIINRVLVGWHYIS